MASAERPALEKRLRAELLELERAEEALIDSEQGRAARLVRRVDASPVAVLCLASEGA